MIKYVIIQLRWHSVLSFFIQPIVEVRRKLQSWCPFVKSIKLFWWIIGNNGTRTNNIISFFAQQAIRSIFNLISWIISISSNVVLAKDMNHVLDVASEQSANVAQLMLIMEQIMKVVHNIKLQSSVAKYRIHRIVARIPVSIG